MPRTDGKPYEALSRTERQALLVDVLLRFLANEDPITRVADVDTFVVSGSVEISDLERRVLLEYGADDE